LYAPHKGEVYAREWNIQGPHPWVADFQRIANDRTPAALVERGVTTAEAFLASVGVLRKGLSYTVDNAILSAEARAGALGIRAAPAVGVFEPAPFEEYDTYIEEYLGYADAMIAVARRHHQEIAFFWEYLLGNLGGMKPMGPVEQRLYEQNRRQRYAIDVVYDARAHDTVHRYCDQKGVPFIDPIDRLRTSDELVFIDYVHYTREGNRFMAKVMYDSLREAIHQRAAAVRSGAR
jgi:hypothetical protein